MCKSLSKKRVLTERNFAFLKQKLGDQNGVIPGPSALASLQSGEAVFIWESSFNASEEEMVNIARQAALEMAPVPGQVILSEIVYLILSAEWSPHLMTVAHMLDLICKGLNAGTHTHNRSPQKSRRKKPFYTCLRRGSRDRKRESLIVFSIVLNALKQRSQGGRYERARNQEHPDRLSEGSQP